MKRAATLRSLGLATVATVAWTSSGCGGGPPRPPCDSGGRLPTLCGLRNPEDVEHAGGARLVLVSNMRLDGDEPPGGYIAAVVLGGDPTLVRMWPPEPGTAPASAAVPDPALGEPACQAPPEPARFYPHGIAVREVDGRSWLYAVAHAGRDGGREAVEIFELLGRGADATLVWKACVPTPDAILANDVSALPDGGLIASNYVPDTSMRHLLSAGLLGTATGNVILWRPGQGWSVIDNTESVMANGVAIAGDGQTLF